MKTKFWIGCIICQSFFCSNLFVSEQKLCNICFSYFIIHKCFVLFHYIEQNTKKVYTEDIILNQYNLFLRK